MRWKRSSKIGSIRPEKRGSPGRECLCLACALNANVGGPTHGVLSDMAAGHRKTDQLRIMGLVELAADFASEVLAPCGFWCCRAGADSELLARLKREFATVRHVKPRASRADSAELYLLATGVPGK
jgi:23S rRNA (uridine2552-2'-O)-methyltransferase